MDERKAYWFEQPYMPRMKNIAVAPVILEDGRLSFCGQGENEKVPKDQKRDWDEKSPI